MVPVVQDLAAALLQARYNDQVRFHPEVIVTETCSEL